MELDQQVDSGVDTSSPPPSTPSVDTGSGDAGGHVSGGQSEGVHPGSSKASGKSIREHLEANVKQVRDGFDSVRARHGLDDETEAPVEKPKRTRKADATSTDADQSTSPGTSPAGVNANASAPPTAWAKDAKESWASVPPAAQAAITKRERDVEKGVAALRDYYKPIDDTLQAYGPDIQQLGLPPGQVINNLFGWMKAFHSNPVQALPALMASYNFNNQTAAAVLEAIGNRYFPDDIALLKRAKANQIRRQQGLPPLNQHGQPLDQPKTQGQPQQPAPPHPEVVKAIQGMQQHVQNQGAYIQQLEQRLQGEIGGINGVFQQQSRAQTDAYLAEWAKDKPFYEDVRYTMAELLRPDPQTGKTIVPYKNGAVDLDAAYDYAIYALPGVRAKVLAQQQAATAQAAQTRASTEAAAQTKAAAEASRKRVSVTSAAPGAAAKLTNQERGLTVRQSLENAIKQTRRAGRV